jgi:hypothetical protein
VTAEVPEINEQNVYNVGSGEILGYGLEIDETCFDSLQWQHIYLSPKGSRISLGPAQPRIQRPDI